MAETDADTAQSKDATHGGADSVVSETVADSTQANRPAAAKAYPDEPVQPVTKPTSAMAADHSTAPPAESAPADAPASASISEVAHADIQAPTASAPAATASEADNSRLARPPSRPHSNSQSQSQSHSQTSLSRRPSQLHSTRPAPLSPAPSRRTSGIGIPTLGTGGGLNASPGRDRTGSESSHGGHAWRLASPRDPGAASGAGAGSAPPSAGLASSGVLSHSQLQYASDALAVSPSLSATGRRISQGSSTGSASASSSGAGAGTGATGTGVVRQPSSAKSKKARPRSSLGTSVYPSSSSNTFAESDEQAKGGLGGPIDLGSPAMEGPNTGSGAGAGSGSGSYSPTKGVARSNSISGSRSGSARSSESKESKSGSGSGSGGGSGSGSNSGHGFSGSSTANAPSDLAALPIPEAGVLTTSPAATPALPSAPIVPSRHTTPGQVYVRDYGFPTSDERHLGLGRPTTPTPLSATARRLSGILFRNRSESQGSSTSDGSEGKRERGWTGFSFSWRGLMNRKPRTSSLSQSATAREADDDEGERDEEYGGTKVDQSDDYAFESDADDDDDDDEDGVGSLNNVPSAHYLGVGRGSASGSASGRGYGYTPRGSRAGGSRRASGIEGIDEEDEDDYMSGFDDDDDNHHGDAYAEDHDEEPVGVYRLAYTFEALGEHEMDVQEGELVHVQGRGGGEGWCVANRLRIAHENEEMGEGDLRRKIRDLIREKQHGQKQALEQKSERDGTEEVAVVDTAAASTPDSSTSTPAPAAAAPAPATAAKVIPTLDLTHWVYEETEEGLVPESYLERVRGRTREFVVRIKERYDAAAPSASASASAADEERDKQKQAELGPAHKHEGPAEIRTVAPDGISEEPADMSDLEDSDGDDRAGGGAAREH